MIMFHTEESIVKEIFNIIDKELYEKEREGFPFHYDILKKKKVFGHILWGGGLTQSKTFEALFCLNVDIINFPFWHF